jgi:hypothetical protein
MWARLSPHPAFEDPEPRRVRPTRTAPIAIFLRESADWLGGAPHSPTLSHAAGEVLAQLESRGACFFNDLVRATGRLASEVEDGLWELVAAGLVTADGFENLRSLVDPKRRRGEGRGKTRAAETRRRPLGVGAPCTGRISQRRTRSRFRRSTSGALGCDLPRFAGPRNASAALARSAAGIAQEGSARRDPRRPLRFRIRGRTIRAPRGTGLAARRPPLRSKC